MIRSNFIKKKKSTFSVNIDKSLLDKTMNKKRESFKKVTDISLVNTTGDIPDSKAFFICGLKNKKEVFIYGGADINKSFISHEVYFYDIEDKDWICLSNVSSIKQFLGLSSDLSGHTYEYLNINGEMKLFVFGGFNGLEYSNKSFLVDSDSFECFEPIDYLQGEIPEGRCYHTSNYFNKQKCIYIYGGWAGNPFALSSEGFTALWKLGLTSVGFIWEKIKLYANDFENIKIYNKRGHTSSIIDDCLYIFCGLEGFNRYTNDCLVIDLKVSNIYLLNKLDLLLSLFKN